MINFKYLLNILNYIFLNAYFYLAVYTPNQVRNIIYTFLKNISKSNALINGKINPKTPLVTRNCIQLSKYNK